MFFLLRVAFWLSIVVILLPSAPTSKNEGGRPINAVEAIGAAHAAVKDARGFCVREPEACETGSQALHAFGQKAQQGAKLLYEFLSDRFADAPASRKEREETGSVTRPGRHTLTAEDALPGWRGRESHIPLPPRRPS